MTWPGVTRLSTALIGRIGGDNYEHVWYLWWIGQVVFDSAGTLINIPVLNYPAGAHVPLNLTHSPTLLIPAIAARLTSPVIAYNLTILMLPTLNAISMYFLALEMTKRRSASIVAGLLFGYSAYLFGHLQAGHLSQVSMIGLPLFVLAFIRLTNRPNWKYAFATGLCAFIAASHPSHVAYMIVPTTCVLIASKPISLSYTKFAPYIVTAALTVIIMLAPFYTPLIGTYDSITTQAAELGGSQSKSMDLASFITPPPDNPWLPSILRPAALRSVATADETHGYLGFIAIALATIGWKTQGRQVSKWIILAAAATLLSLGPLLRLSGTHLHLLVDGSHHPIQLPYAFLSQIPILNWSRTPARFASTLHFVLAILAAYGVAALLSRIRRRNWQHLVTVAICALALAERLITWPFPSTPTWQTPALITLGDQIADRAVLNIPSSFTSNARALYGQTVHQLPIIGGRVFRGGPEDELNQRFLDASLRNTPVHDIITQPSKSDRIALLSAHKVGAILQHHMAETYQPEQRDFLISILGDPHSASLVESLFLVPDKFHELAHPTYAIDPYDWHPPELWATNPARWFSDQGLIYIYSPQESKGHLQLTTIPGHQLHRVQVAINDDTLTTLIVGDWVTYNTPDTTLSAGLNTVTFTDLDGAELLWGDLRCSGGTQIAGPFSTTLSCDPHVKGKRLISIALQSIAWHPSPNSPPMARFGDELILDDVTWPSGTKVGDTLELTVIARTTKGIGDDLTFFTHLLNDDGSLLSQWDSAPLRGQFNTSSWQANQQLGFRFAVPIPQDSPPGTYRVALGWYKTSTGIRLPITASTHDDPDNVLEVGSVLLREHP